jgi:hypothetical protein
MEINFLCDYGSSKGLASELPEENFDFASVMYFVTCHSFLKRKNIRASSLNERNDAK